MTKALHISACAIMIAALGTMSRAEAVQKVDTVIVLDFDNKSGAVGDPFVRLATDAVAVELAATSRYEVLRRDEVNKQIKELGLRPPLSWISQRKLAQALGATIIVDGTLEFIKDDLKAKPRTLSVGLTVRLTDVSSGELISGAAQIGSAKAGPGASDTHGLITEAISSLGTSIPRLALSQPAPDGIVMSSDSFGRARIRMINRGATHGVKKGMKFMVLRDGARIGTAEAINVFPQHSEVRILEGDQLIRTEDRIRAIGRIVGSLK